MKYQDKTISGWRKPVITLVAGLAGVISSASLPGCAEYQSLAGGNWQWPTSREPPFFRNGNNKYYSLVEDWNITDETKDVYIISRRNETRTIKKKDLTINGKPAELRREGALEGILERIKLDFQF